ncbi:hypothetical protein GEMRC1_010560 [Eukaryota sp. GEM-RC1]
MVRLIEIGINQSVLIDFDSQLDELYSFLRSNFSSSLTDSKVFSLVFSFVAEKGLRNSTTSGINDFFLELQGLSSDCPAVWNYLISESAEILVKHSNSEEISTYLGTFNSLILDHQSELTTNTVKSVIDFYAFVGQSPQSIVDFVLSSTIQSNQEELKPLIDDLSIRLIGLGDVIPSVDNVCTSDPGKRLSNLVSIIGNQTSPVIEEVFMNCLSVVSNPAPESINQIRLDFERLLVTSHDVDLWLLWLRFEQLLDSEISRVGVVISRAVKRLPSYQSFFKIV